MKLLELALEIYKARIAAGLDTSPTSAVEIADQMIQAAAKKIATQKG